MFRTICFSAIFAGFACFAGTAWAVEPRQQQNSNAVWFENWVGLSNATLKVSAPDGTLTEIHAASGTPVFKLPARDASDGVWRFELSAATDKQEKIVNVQNNGRGDAARDTVAVPYYLSGHFVVERGVIIRPKEIKEEDASQDQ